MSTSTTVPRRKPAPKRKSRKKQSPGWLVWWPLILGIAITPITVKAATLIALSGPDGLRLLYPWMLIPKLYSLRLSDSLVDSISQAAMYLQFPLYGFLAMLIHRWKSVKSAILQLTLLHLLAVGLILVAGRG